MAEGEGVARHADTEQSRAAAAEDAQVKQQTGEVEAASNVVLQAAEASLRSTGSFDPLQQLLNQKTPDIEAEWCEWNAVATNISNWLYRTSWPCRSRTHSRGLSVSGPRLR